MYEYNAKVLDVYDGDTFTLRIDLGCDVFTIQKVRLYGINTPEVRGKDKVFGKEVREYVRTLILGEVVRVNTFKDKKGKFGRYLARVNFEGMDLTEHLLEKKYGVEYMKTEG